MYNIRILYDTPFWAYYWRALALQKYAPDDFNIEIGSDYGKAFKEKEHHLVLQLAYSYARDLRHHMNMGGYKFPLVSSFNVGWNYKNAWLDETMKYSDYTIINNYEMWDKAGRRPKTIPISNGVDRCVFQCKTPIESRKMKVLWVGSTNHRKTKNFDTIITPLATLLRKNKISYEFRLVRSNAPDRWNQHQMANWYNTGSIYICASDTEGTPNPALEAASCGCTVISTPVGNMPELIQNGINGYLCDKSVKSIFDTILKASSEIQSLQYNMQESIKSWDWKYRSKEYYDFFRKVMSDDYSS